MPPRKRTRRLIGACVRVMTRAQVRLRWLSRPAGAVDSSSIAQAARDCRAPPRTCFSPFERPRPSRLRAQSRTERSSNRSRAATLDRRDSANRRQRWCGQSRERDSAPHQRSSARAACNCGRSVLGARQEAASLADSMRSLHTSSPRLCKRVPRTSLPCPHRTLVVRDRALADADFTPQSRLQLPAPQASRA